MRALLVASLLAIPVMSFAQERGRTYGIIFGLNFANVDMTGLPGCPEYSNCFPIERSRRGVTEFLLGVSATIPWTETIAIRPEVLISRKGTRNGYQYTFDNRPVGQSMNDKRVLTYLEVPVLAELRFPTENESTFMHLLAGPAMAFNVGCHFEYDYAYDGKGSGSGSCDKAHPDATAFDLGIVLGGGIRADNVTFELRYELGLSNVSRYERLSAKNRVLSLVAGIPVLR